MAGLTVSREAVCEFVTRCGLDPNLVRGFAADHGVLAFTVYETDADGERYLVAGELATRTVKVGIATDPAEIVGRRYNVGDVDLVHEHLAAHREVTLANLRKCPEVWERHQACCDLGTR